MIISTINVCQGLNQRYKRDIIIKRIKDNYYDITFLQELKICYKSQKQNLQKEWDGKLYCSYGDGKKKY